MCIIAAKSAGVKFPSDEILYNMWSRNNDGAGFMFAHDGKVNIEKGFMKYADFKARIDELKTVFDLDALPMVLHFRITTHGGTKPENCHPFPISDSVGMLSKLKLSTDIGVAHNGIIHITPRKGISDTMEYIASQLYPLKRMNSKFYKDKWAMQLVANAIDSKMAILNKEGNIYTIGEFIESDGVMYSNSSYEGWKHFKDYYYGTDEDESWNCGWGREDECYTFGKKSYSYTSLMWLDYDMGEHIECCGEEYEGDFAIDYLGNVYEYDMKYDTWEFVPYARAIGSDGKEIMFDEESGMTSRELIFS